MPRARILHSLENTPGQHLIIVRYAPSHLPDPEWVYNAADIDASKVVWARDMDEQNNQELLQYFKNRTVWLLEPDESPPKLSPYPAAVREESIKSQPDSGSVDSTTAKYRLLLPPRFLRPEQKTQRIRKALRPLSLVVSCALVDLHQQAAIVQARASQAAFEFADIFDNLPVFVVATSFPGAYRQKHFRRPLSKMACVLQDPSIGNKQRRAFQQQVTKHRRAARSPCTAKSAHPATTRLARYFPDLSRCGIARPQTA